MRINQFLALQHCDFSNTVQPQVICTHGEARVVRESSEVVFQRTSAKAELQHTLRKQVAVQ